MSPQKPHQKRWTEANRDYVRAQQKEYGRTHREQFREYWRAWTKRHPDRARLLRKVSAANRIYPDKITIEDVVAVVEASGRKCCWCGKENLHGKDLTLEHLEPFNRRECLAISCMSCNAARISTHGPRKTEEEKLERQRIANKVWYDANIEKARMKAREWARENRQRLAAKAKEQREKAAAYDVLIAKKESNGSNES